MKAHYEIIQGTDEWHAIRHGKIGGTSASGLFVKSDTLIMDIVAECSEEFEPSESFQNAAMQRGNELEPFAISELEKYTGLKFKSVGWLQSTEIPLIGISPDGITEDETIQCEIKCPGSKQHIKNCLNEGIELEYFSQLVHAFSVNPQLNIIYFASYRPEAIRPLSVRYLNRESIVNLGTKSKPVNKTITEWVEIAHEEAKRVQTEVYFIIDKLKF